jgi:hypothetical protein
LAHGLQMNGMLHHASVDSLVIPCVGRAKL